MRFQFIFFPPFNYVCSNVNASHNQQHISRSICKTARKPSFKMNFHLNYNDFRSLDQCSSGTNRIQ